MITQQIELALRAIAISSFWQGWADHGWNREQLEWFQEYFATNDVRQIVPTMIMGERAYSGTLIKNFTPGRPDNEPSSNIATRIIRSRNQIALARLIKLLIEESRRSLESERPLFQPDKDYAQMAGIPREHPNAALHERFPETKPDAGLFSSFSHPYTAMTVGLVRPFIRVMATFDHVQVKQDLTETVCALERYWLEHGEYPDELVSLVPTYLSEVPQDLMDGQPLRYRKRDDGWFDLYSVGEDQEDDGGIYAPAAIGEQEHDLPWPLPIPQTAPRLF